MPSRRKLLRSLWHRRGGRRKQRAGRPSGTSGTAAKQQRSAAPPFLPGFGRGLTALAILAGAFGPMPDVATGIDASTREESMRTPRNVLDKFLADSRQYFGL
jgi:hypothetical protein